MLLQNRRILISKYFVTHVIREYFDYKKIYINNLSPQRGYDFLDICNIFYYLEREKKSEWFCSTK